MTDYLIVGNGAAGTHAAEAIRKEDGGRSDHHGDGRGSALLLSYTA